MLTILLPLLVTVNLFVLSKSNILVSLQNPWLFTSQLFSIIGTLLLCFTFVLGSRARFLENIFGGLDKVIKIHHILGGISFVLLLHHPLFLAVQALPNYTLSAKYLFFSSNAVYNYGVISLYGMVMLLLLTLIVRLPYDVWLRTHDMFGIVLFFASLHIYFISSDVSRYLPLRIWMFVNLAIALFFYVYKVFLYKWFGPRYGYSVEKINQIGDVLEVYLTPNNEGVKFKPGQFGFVSFEKEGLTEEHPFSFSSSPDDNLVRFSVKILGDYTLKLRNLPVGTKCSVWGSYGKFYYGFNDKNDVVCIARGIGITPFVSLIAYEHNHILDRKIYLFYSAKSEKEAIYHDYFVEMQAKLPNFIYCPNFGSNNRLNCEALLKETNDFLNKLFFICGPTPMMYSLSNLLKRNGVKSRNIIFEDFNFKQ